MVLINEFGILSISAPKRHAEVEARLTSYKVDGEQFAQINTYGKPDRVDSGTSLQSIQLNQKSAEHLVAFLQKKFNL